MARGGTLTSGAIAQEAGLAQPSFYAHFKSVDAARLAAAELAAERLAHLDQERRNRLAARPADLPAVAEELERWLRQLETTGPLHDALAPYARESSALGGMVRALGDHTRTRLADDLFDVARRAGVGPEHYREFLHQAELMIAATTATGRMLRHGQLSDVRAAAWVLARNFFATMQVSIVACGGTPNAVG